MSEKAIGVELMDEREIDHLVARLKRHVEEDELKGVTHGLLHWCLDAIESLRIRKDRPPSRRYKNYRDEVAELRARRRREHEAVEKVRDSILKAAHGGPCLWDKWLAALGEILDHDPE